MAIGISPCLNLRANHSQKTELEPKAVGGDTIPRSVYFKRYSLGSKEILLKGPGTTLLQGQCVPWTRWWLSWAWTPSQASESRACCGFLWAVSVQAPECMFTFLIWKQGIWGYCCAGKMSKLNWQYPTKPQVGVEKNKTIRFSKPCLYAFKENIYNIGQAMLISLQQAWK